MKVWMRLRAVRGVALSLFLALFVLLVSGRAHAQETPTQIVRVGWFESPYNITDEHGRKSGYSYDYQQKIAAYTGWTYEYVEGSWPELLKMLVDGRIDLLSDVSYTPERSEQMLFSSNPMGAEEYYLLADPKNTEITPEDYSTFNGKRVGVNKGSIQADLFKDWAKNNGIEAELVELTGLEEQNQREISKGNIDLYLSVDAVFDKKTAVPICRIGTSDFYFAVSKSRPELLTDLNNAMSRVLDEDREYNHLLYAKYLQTASMKFFLNANEKTWLESKGAIRIGYQDDYLAFCATDPRTGELTGALSDYLAVASDCLENAHVNFEPIAYATSADAMEALRTGEVDCVFPANLTDYDGETHGLFITPSLISTDVSAIIRQEDQRSFAQRDWVTVAVNTDDPNFDLFLQGNFPDWRPIYFSDTQKCLKAVSEGQVDCLLISDYRYNSIADLCEAYDLTTWSTGVEMDYSFAVTRGNTFLYSILAKIVGIVPRSTVNAALTSYFMEEARVDTTNPLVTVIPIIAIGALSVAVLVLAFILHDVRAGQQDGEGRKTKPGQEDFALFDDLPLSYSVYHVTSIEHSKLCDAEFIYANHAFEQMGGHLATDIIGHHVRELYPYIKEEWFGHAKRAALDGDAVEYEYVDALSGKSYRCFVQQVIGPGYCAITYLDA